MSLSSLQRLPAKCAVLLLVALIFPATIAAGANPRELPQKTKLTARLDIDYFIVHYDPKDPYLAKLMARAAREKLLEIAPKLGYNPDKNRPFPLYIYRSHMDFIRAGGLQERKFTVGTADSGNEAISVDASGAFALPDEIIAHEVTHAIIFRILGAGATHLPLWLNEGLAQYMSEPVSKNHDAILANAAADSTLPPLKVLRSGFPDDRIDIAYAASAAAVNYMIKSRGDTVPRKLLAELKQSGSIDDAMADTVGLELAAFEEEWYSHANHRYWAIRFSRFVLGVVSVVMAVLAVVAFFIRRKQKIEQARRWEEEEFNDWISQQMKDYNGPR